MLSRSKTSSSLALLRGQVAAGRTGCRVQIETELGELAVLWRDDDVVELVGPAELVARGTFWLPQLEAH